jgi:hypothetical protein
MDFYQIEFSAEGFLKKQVLSLYLREDLILSEVIEFNEEFKVFTKSLQFLKDILTEFHIRISE